VQLGGDGRRVRLNVYQEPVHFDLVDSAEEADVIFTNKPPPKFRSQCVEGTRYTGSLEERLLGRRFCGHVATCRAHLWFREGESRAGRRHYGRFPPDTIRPGTMVSCAMDLIQARPAGWTAEATATALGLTKRRVEMITKEALAKLRTSGIDLDDLDEPGVAPRGLHASRNE